MKLQVFTRSINPVLFELSGQFLPPDIARIKCDTFNTWKGANDYLHHIIVSGSQWVVNLDEDAFITDWEVILNIIDYMEKNGYEYCGMPDGGVCHHRFHSWIVCNPFFNIFNVKLLKEKMPSRQVIDSYKFREEMENKRPEFVGTKYANDYFEPFNNLFYWLIDHSKGLYLNAMEHADQLSTVLLWNDKPFLYHSWFARDFNSNTAQKTRITALYEEAKRVLKSMPIEYSHPEIENMRPVVLATYRDREDHLARFLPAIKSAIPDAAIYVIEQADDQPFNKGALYNIGFKEAEGAGDYFIFHDIDLLPRMDKYVDYSYCHFPTHISAYCSQFNYKVPYANIFGGVIIVTPEHYRAVNGFPNSFRGWGGEDDIFYNSFISKHIPINRKNCWFESLPHPRNLDKQNYAHNLRILRMGRNFSDGLDSCKYEVVSLETKEGYIHLKVKPDTPAISLLPLPKYARTKQYQRRQFTNIPKLPVEQPNTKI